jgi:hypothetical protein
MDNLDWRQSRPEQPERLRLQFICVLLLIASVNARTIASLAREVSGGSNASRGYGPQRGRRRCDAGGEQTRWR